MGVLEEYKPALAMIVAQFIFAGVSLFTRAALLKGMSATVFVVYRQVIATLVIAPVAFFSSRRQINSTSTTTTSSLNCRSFCLCFLASLFGRLAASLNLGVLMLKRITGTQNAYFKGLDMATTSISIATTNLIPSITFVMAFVARIEKVDLRSKRSVAKVVGTVICIFGAICLYLFKGPKLLNSAFVAKESLYNNSHGQNLLVGFLFLLGSCCCWSVWLILQVPISECYPDHMSSSAWVCFISTLQTGALALFLERDRPEAWIIHPNIELASCLYSGIIGSGVGFFLQAWCIAKKGPLYFAMFYPLSTLIGTVFGSLLLHEQIYTGSLVGICVLIIGLYVVLWGKAEDSARTKEEKTTHVRYNPTSLEIDLEEPRSCNNKSSVC